MANRGAGLGKYILQRIALTVPMIWLVLTLVFLLLHVAPSDPVQIALGGKVPESVVDDYRAAAGLNKPLLEQYVSYLGSVSTGDLGTTLTDNRAITSILATNGAATLELAVAAMLVAVVGGIPVGLLCARFRDTVFDAFGRLVGIVSFATPAFFLGLLSQLLFNGVLHWLPNSGEASARVIVNVESKTNIVLIDALIAGNMDGAADALVHLILPALTLGLVLSGVFLRMTRANVIHTLQTGYVEAAASRGIGRVRILIRYAFRNALIPVVTMIGLWSTLLLSGAVLTEATFDWPGLGHALILYLQARDYPAVQGIITVFALVVVGFSLITDIVVALLDPRVGYGKV